MVLDTEQPALETYRPSRTRALWAIGLLALTGAALLYQAFVVATGIAMTANLESVTDADIDRWASAFDSAGLLVSAVSIAAAVAFLAWLSRAVENTPALGGGSPDFSPREAIGWWFVPIANFVRGYQIVADLWQRMGGGSTRLVLVWWILWLGSEAVGLAFGVLPAPTTIEAVQTRLALEGVSLVASAIAAGLGIWIIRQTEQLIRARATGAPAPTLQPAG